MLRVYTGYIWKNLSYFGRTSLRSIILIFSKISTYIDISKNFQQLILLNIGLECYIYEYICIYFTCIYRLYLE